MMMIKWDATYLKRIIKFDHPIRFRFSQDISLSLDVSDLVSHKYVRLIKEREGRKREKERDDDDDSVIFPRDCHV